jgi:hypothetical protein
MLGSLRFSGWKRDELKRWFSANKPFNLEKQIYLQIKNETYENA